MSLTVDEICSVHRHRRPVIMGILNVTPDSFSDGGQFVAPQAAVARAEAMLVEGADILDVGAESSRPGSLRVSPDDQIRRLEPILPALVALGVPVSIDTTSAAVAEMALDAGACIVNDIAAGREDSALLPLAGRHGAAVVLMHMLGEPKTMQQSPCYDDVLTEVRHFLAQRMQAAQQVGVSQDRLIVDPGIGFGKTLEHNLTLLAGVEALTGLGVPVLIGASRKRFIGAITGEQNPALRVGGSIAAACAAYSRGARLFRVHDVAATRQGLDVLAAIASAG